jgi:sec-independent protein translocase protein TatA
MIQFNAGWIGGPEIVVIVIVVLLLFGGKKIPELAKGIGKGIRDFRNAVDENDITKDIKDVGEEFKNVKEDVENLNPKNVIKPKSTSSSKKK